MRELMTELMGMKTSDASAFAAFSDDVSHP
jgi:hypothetical protein